MGRVGELADELAEELVEELVDGANVGGKE